MEEYDISMSKYRMKRDPDLQKVLDKITEAEFGISNTAAGNAGICIICGSNVSYDSFRDEDSRIEYGMSRLCQKCQDSVYSGGDE